MMRLLSLRRLLIIAVLIGAAIIVPLHSATPTFACVPSGGDCYNNYSATYSYTVNGHTDALTVYWSVALYAGTIKTTGCSANQGNVEFGNCNEGPNACPGPLPPFGRFAYNGELLTINVYCSGSWQGSHSP